MEVCNCCQDLISQLEEHFRNGNDDQFYQLFSHHAEKSASNFPQFEPYTELSLVVRFKLQVHFAVFNSSSSASNKYSNGMEKLSIFLQEEGKKYAKFPELAQYFALPYISTENNHHPILNEIRTENWINLLSQQWKQVLKMQIHHYHGFDESKIERLNTSSLKLKRKFSKLKEDHKILLDLASSLIKALEEILEGKGSETKCTLEAFEYYSHEIKTLSNSLDESNKDAVFQWEANSLKKSDSIISIESKSSLD